MQVSWFSILYGMTSAVETLASQLNGAKRYSEVGMVLQRSYVVLACFMVPVLVAWSVAVVCFGGGRGGGDIMNICLYIYCLKKMMLTIRLVNLTD